MLLCRRLATPGQALRSNGPSTSPARLSFGAPRRLREQARSCGHRVQHSWSGCRPVGAAQEWRGCAPRRIRNLAAGKDRQARLPSRRASSDCVRATKSRQRVAAEGRVGEFVAVGSSSRLSSGGTDHCRRRLRQHHLAKLQLSPASAFKPNVGLMALTVSTTAGRNRCPGAIGSVGKPKTLWASGWETSSSRSWSAFEAADTHRAAPSRRKAHSPPTHRSQARVNLRSLRRLWVSICVCAHTFIR